MIYKCVVFAGNICIAFVQCWTNIVQMIYKCFVFAGKSMVSMVYTKLFHRCKGWTYYRCFLLYIMLMVISDPTLLLDLKQNQTVQTKNSIIYYLLLSWLSHWLWRELLTLFRSLRSSLSDKTKITVNLLGDLWFLICGVVEVGLFQAIQSHRIVSRLKMSREEMRLGFSQVEIVDAHGARLLPWPVLGSHEMTVTWIASTLEYQEHGVAVSYSGFTS